jgi:hypothetical protein
VTLMPLKSKKMFFNFVLTMDLLVGLRKNSYL